MRVDSLDLVFKRNRTVTLNFNCFVVTEPNLASLTHVYLPWQKEVLLRVDDWVGVDGD